MLILFLAEKWSIVLFVSQYVKMKIKVFRFISQSTMLHHGYLLRKSKLIAPITKPVKKLKPLNVRFSYSPPINKEKHMAL